jgi:glycosyltransferase involved in cell wall biosynthesis
MSKAPVSVIILTYNEEVNIRACLESVKDLTDEIFIVDSYSTDRTLEIARKYTDKIYQNVWTNNPIQRQWALTNLPLSYDWIFFLDADERLTTSLKNEIIKVLSQEILTPKKGGYYVLRKFFFLGKNIKWGDCKAGLAELRLCNRHNIKIKDRAGRVIYISDIEVGYINEYMIHEDLKPLAAWIDRHNRYSSEEAQFLFCCRTNQVSFNLDRNETKDIKLWIKELFRQKIWNRLPIGFRPTILFLYYYFIKLGFLDGPKGFYYHFLHTFWYRLLIDAKYLELKNRKYSETTIL